MKKINFKQPKYIFPLILLPFIVFIGYQLISFINIEPQQVQEQKGISASLGKVEEPILSKSEAYERLFQATKDNRTMIQEIEKETDSLFTYSENMNFQQKRYLDSLRFEKDRRINQITETPIERITYYSTEDAKIHEEKQKDEEDFNRSKEIIRMLNETQNPSQNVAEEKEEYDPVKGLREQMLFLDSLEKAKDPDFKNQQKLKELQRKREEFQNQIFDVRKSKNSNAFNHISNKKENNTIKATIDENTKGYLGSRIRIRLLDDVTIGKRQVKKGAFLYAEISGFSQQRVYLNIVSVMIDQEIYPINLSIYDTDGMKGLYVPASAYREMAREFGSNSAQGINLESGEQGFFTSIASNLFRSASETIVSIIRKNKVTLKYNSHIYLINENNLKKNEN